MEGNTSGVLYGGWNFVIAAYGLSWATLIAYTVSLVLRGRRVS